MKAQIEQAWKAVQFDRLSELKELVPSVVSVNASTGNPDNHVHTLLMCAAAHGAVNCAEYLIENDVDVNAKNFAGYTALHWAAYTGRTETLQLLISNQADIEARTEDGKTPLHIAAFRGHLDFVESLLSLNADINAIACNGWTALHFALISNQRMICEKLVTLGINSEFPDTDGKTCQDLADKYKREWFSALNQTM